MQKREFQAECKLLGEPAECGSFEGVAAVFSNIDRQNDIILPGAFLKTLEDFPRRGFLANAHDWTEPIGTITSAVETPEGLRVAGEFHSTPSAQLVRKVMRERLERGKQVAMSIGFNVLDQDFDTKAGVRQLKELDLYEVSIVTVPANPLAHIASVKAVEIDADLEARRTEMRCIQLQRLAAASEYERTTTCHSQVS
jgi:HK97 family phage prohead protease